MQKPNDPPDGKKPVVIYEWDPSRPLPENYVDGSIELLSPEEQAWFADPKNKAESVPWLRQDPADSRMSQRLREREAAQAAEKPEEP